MATFRVVKTDRRSFSGGPSQADSAQITYTVSPTGTDTPPATEFEALQAVKADFGTRHPDYPLLVWSRSETRPRGGADNVMEVTITYEIITTRGPTDDPDDDLQPGFTDWGVSTSVQFISVWRDLSTVVLPADFTTLEGPVVDSNGDRVSASGLPIDSRGEPVSDEIRQQRLDVTQVIDRVPTFSLYRDLAGTRNKSEIFGVPPGFLLYLGANSSGRLGPNVYRIVHTFVFDEFGHLRQAPEMNTDGRPEVSQASNPYTYSGTNYADVALTVNWVQPFPGLEEFDRLGIQGIPDAL